MDRTFLTPGKLYARLSAEFRKRRPAECSTCQMPMVYTVDSADPDAPNWNVEAPRCCEQCVAIVRELVERFGHEFDVFDPISATFRRPLHGTAFGNRAH